MAKSQLHHLMRGALVLTIASFVAKLLSAIYRVPFQNLVGDQGFYVYQQVYPLYGIAITLALTSFPQFLSRVTVGQNPLEKRETLKAYFPMIATLSLGLWFFLFTFSGIVAFAMGNRELAPLIRVVSFTFLLIPSLAIRRGEFQGSMHMIPTAVSQVVEQIVRVIVILLAAYSFKAFDKTVYQVGTYALSGSLVGGIAAFFVLRYYAYQIHGGHIRLTQLLGPYPEKRIRYRFYKEAGMLTIYGSLLIIFQLIDSFFVVNGLVASGMPLHEAQVTKGIFDRGQPLVQLGLVVATALSASFLPALTNYLTANREAQFRFSAKMYLRLTVSVAFAASLGLASLMPFINYTLFKDFKGTNTLLIFVFSIVLMATVQAYQSIAQSQNRLRLSLRAASWGCAIKLFLTGILTYRFGTVGTSFATLSGLFVVFLVFLRYDDRKLYLFFKERSFFIRLGIALFGMAVSLLIYNLAWYYGIQEWHRSTTLWISLLGVVLGASVFLFLTIKCQVFTVREWLYLPKGAKILRLGVKK